MKKVLITGAGGFIGGHLVQRLKRQRYWTRAVDLKYHEFSEPPADEFILGDLRDQNVARRVVEGIDEVYQLAADMGGAGYIFTGEHDASVMHNSATINLNILEYGMRAGVKKFFYSSSACIYPEYNQRDPLAPKCSEDSAYPAAPDSEYGWEKLFSERLYMAYMRNYGVQVRVARFHNVLRLMESTFPGPMNIGSEEMLTINHLAGMIIDIAGKTLKIRHVPGPLGVRGRNSDNQLIYQKLGWKPGCPLREGLSKTYSWISARVSEARVQAVTTVAGCAQQVVSG